METILKINSLLRQIPFSKHQVGSFLLRDTLLPAWKSWKLLLFYAFSDISETKNARKVIESI